MLEAKLSKSIRVMNKPKHTLPKNAFRTLYYSVVYPHLLYGQVVLGSSFKTYLKPIYTLQNCAVKIIYGGHWKDHATLYYI